MSAQPQQPLPATIRKSDVVAMLDERAVRIVFEHLGVTQFTNAGENWLVRAPYRQDNHPSLSVRKRDGVWNDKGIGKGGSLFDAVMLTQNCDFKTALLDVARVVGMGTGRDIDRVTHHAAPVTPTCIPQPVSPGPTVYPYRGEDGTLLYEIVRHTQPDGSKTFTARRPAGPSDPAASTNSGFMPGIGGQRRVLYRLPDLGNADPSVPVYLVEGEKDADRLASIGLLATTNPFGAGSWENDYTLTLHGRSVVILPDNDEPGQKHAARVALALQGSTREVRVINLPGLPPSGDVSDWLDAGGSFDELVRLTQEARPKRFSDKVPVAVVTELADVMPEEVNWLWPDWLPRGKLTLLGGHPGDGKSTLTAAFAAILSRGDTWPDGSAVTAPASTLFLLAEDALGDTLRPRLDQHGADVSRIGAIEAIRNPDGSETMFSLGEHLAALERRIVERDILPRRHRPTLRLPAQPQPQRRWRNPRSAHPARQAGRTPQRRRSRRHARRQAQRDEAHAAPDADGIDRLRRHRPHRHDGRPGPEVGEPRTQGTGNRQKQPGHEAAPA